MGRKVHRVPVSLNSQGIKKISDSEIAIILRGADELIMTGGRRLLARILKGSKEKRLLELGLDSSPVYGALHDLSLEQVMARIDWLIIKGYLARRSKEKPIQRKLWPGWIGRLKPTTRTHPLTG